MVTSEVAAIVRHALPLVSDEAARTARILTVAAGTEVVHQGEDAHDLFVVLSGELYVVQQLLDEREVVGTVGPGETFGQVGVTNTGFRTATVIARTAARLAVVTP